MYISPIYKIDLCTKKSLEACVRNWLPLEWGIEWMGRGERKTFFIVYSYFECCELTVLKPQIKQKASSNGWESPLLFHFHSHLGAGLSLSPLDLCSGHCLVSLPPVSLSFLLPIFHIAAGESTCQIMSLTSQNFQWHPMAHRIKFQLCFSIPSLPLSALKLPFQYHFYRSLYTLSLLSFSRQHPPPPKKKEIHFLNFCFFFFKSLKYPFSRFAVKTEFCFQGLFWTLFSFSSLQLPAIYPQNESFIFGFHRMCLIPLALILLNCSLIGCLHSIFRLPCIDPSFQPQ